MNAPRQTDQTSLQNTKLTYYHSTYINPAATAAYWNNQKDSTMCLPIGCLLACCFIASQVIGCGSADPVGGADRPNVIPVSGHVTFDGKPLDGANVTFIPTGTEPGAFGVTDAEGKFSLQTFIEGDGAAAGSYTVTIIKNSKPSVDESVIPAIDAPPASVDQKSLVPEHYGDPSRSGLGADVTADGKNSFDFALEK